MCQECGVTNGHTTPCPNNPKCNLDEPELVLCPICEQEVPDDQILWGVCDECLGKAETFENAMQYGEENKATIEINALFVKVLTSEEIYTLLYSMVLKLKSTYPLAFKAYIHELCADDSSAFADWLKERKKGGG